MIQHRVKEALVLKLALLAHHDIVSPAFPTTVTFTF